MIYINILMEVNFEVKNDIITFKGVKDGVYLNIKGSDLELIIKSLEKKLSKSLKFYKGVKFLGVKGKDLSNEQILEINLKLKYKYDFDISLDEIMEHMKDIYRQEALREKEAAQKAQEEQELEEISDLVSEDIEEITKFVYGTLRSGQEIEYHGNVVIIGDVNPGALIRSKGNIIVLGTLRGVAHAGFDGNTNSIVAAYNLLPSQLRIANLIVRAPDDEIAQYKLPEVAKICGGEVVIEPYLPNK